MDFTSESTSEATSEAVKQASETRTSETAASE
jgi:hypothetical protein